MGISATAPTTRRGYLSQDELQQYADITITDTNEADDQISQAEELIDSYVGFQKKFAPGEVEGRCASLGASLYLYLDSDQQNVYQNDYFKLMEVEIVGGTGEGQRRKITASDYATGKITVDTAWTTIPDTTSFYRIYQLGKFPRINDVRYYSDSTPYQYYKTIPEAVKRAVAAQVEFLIEMGAEYFSTDKTSKESESIGDYSYSNSKGAGDLNRLIAPKAKMLLRSIFNRVGEMA